MTPIMGLKRWENLTENMDESEKQQINMRIRKSSNPLVRVLNKKHTLKTSEMNI